MSQIRTGPTKMMINSKLLLVCFLIVIVALLGAKVVPTTGKEPTTTQTQASAPDRTAATAPSETGGRTPDKTSNKQRQTDASPALVSNSKINQQQASGSNVRKCEYDKGQWDECEANGVQQKVMRLKWGGPECKQTKTIRRECKAKGEAGCKYARGEWSSVCQNGLRVRVDTLVGPAGGVHTNELARANHMRCKPQRRVTKDCRRTCHYTKSGWSECSNGFRTRVLTLADQVNIQSGERGDESNPGSPSSELSSAGGSDKQPQTRAGATNQTVNEICVRQKLIRRKCAPGESKTAGASSLVQQQQQRQRENSQQASSNLTPAQRRRLKQLQLKQQQQQQPAPVTTTGAPQPPTTTNKVGATSSGIGSSLTSTTTTAKTATLAKSGRR